MPEQYFVYLSKSIQKSVSKIPDPWRRRINQALVMLEVDPFYGERMTGKLQNNRKIRLWPYRIIYKIDEKKKIVIIVEVGHRGGLASYR